LNYASVASQHISYTLYTQWARGAAANNEWQRWVKQICQEEVINHGVEDKGVVDLGPRERAKDMRREFPWSHSEFQWPRQVHVSHTDTQNHECWVRSWTCMLMQPRSTGLIIHMVLVIGWCITKHYYTPLTMTFVKCPSIHTGHLVSVMAFSFNFSGD
jgi:hypothetical protein